MSPELLKGFFRAGIFVAGTSLALLFLVEPDSAEFVVSAVSLLIGALLLVLVALVLRFLR
jgi:hypothetical protein